MGFDADGSEEVTIRYVSFIMKSGSVIHFNVKDFQDKEKKGFDKMFDDVIDYGTLTVTFNKYGKEYDYLAPREMLEDMHKAYLEKHDGSNIIATVPVKGGETKVVEVSGWDVNRVSGKATSLAESVEMILDHHSGLLEYRFRSEDYLKETIQEKKMNTSTLQNKMMDKFFKKLDNVKFDITSGKVGIEKNGSIFTCTKDEDGDYTLTENIMGDFGMAIPAFAQATPIADIKEGDLVAHNNSIGWVTKINTEKGEVKVLTANSSYSNIKPATQAMGGGKTVMKVISMMGDTGGLGQMQGMIQLMAMAGGDEGDLEKMMPMMLMMQSGGFGDQAQVGNMTMPLLMMNMLKK